MNPYFLLVLAVLILGTGSSLYGFGEWAYHGYRNRTIFLWSMGLLFLNWYQLPTLMALSGQQVILTDFNLLFALALPVAFLGFATVYLGSRFMISRVPWWTTLVLAAWFGASLVFYGTYYRSASPFDSVWPVIGSNLLFFAPIFFLNLWVAISIYRKVRVFGRTSFKLGAAAYVAASCFGLVRNVFSLFFGLTHSPQFAALRFFDPPFIIAQAAGLAFLLVAFALLHTVDLAVDGAGQAKDAGQAAAAGL